MADALCGPSNALQNFQKHTTVDRTLQQDRLVGRHSSSQGFRSSQAHNTGAIDSEFETFQAGRPAPPPQDFHHPPPQFAYAPPQQHFAQAPQAPSWATDFQRLNISSPPIQRQQPQPASAATAWHQDFSNQQAPATQASAFQQQSAYGGMAGPSMGGFAAPMFMQTPGFQNAPASQVAQGKQRAQEATPAFDDAAFEQAFLQAEAHAEQAMHPPFNGREGTHSVGDGLETMGYDRAGELDPLLIRIREARPAVYSAIQVWSETGLGHTAEAVAYLENMTSLEQSGKLVEDANEARWIVDSLQRIANQNAPQEVKTRTENLIKAINERLMSQYPFGARIPMSEEKVWEELEAAGYMRTPEHERVEEQPEPMEEEQPQHHNDDEMAATAGKLLERVSDNTSEKFQNSQFLELMRRLRDREVRVEEDKIVELNKEASARRSLHADSRIPPIDSSILDHADTDFAMPDYPDQDQVAQKTSAEDAKEPQIDPYQIQLMKLEQQNKERLRLAREQQERIAREEQDEDRWRYVSPGRDPVGEERGPGM